MDGVQTWEGHWLLQLFEHFIGKSTNNFEALKWNKISYLTQTNFQHREAPHKLPFG